MRTILAFILTVSCVFGVYAQTDGVKWQDSAYSAEFKYLVEAEMYDAASWNGLTPEEQLEQISEVRAAALARQKEVSSFYAGMSAKWTLDNASSNIQSIGTEELKGVRVWLGDAKAGALSAKKEAVYMAMLAYQRGTITEAEISAASPYMDQAAISEMSSAAAYIKSKGGAAGYGTESAKQKTADRKREAVGGKLNTMERYNRDRNSGASSQGDRYFDGSGEFSGSVPEGSSAKSGDVRLGSASLGSVGALRKGSLSAASLAESNVPSLSPAASREQRNSDYTQADLSRIDSVVADMKAKRQAQGSENGWWGNFKQTIGKTKQDSGCSSWSMATVDAIKKDPVLSEKYEAGYVVGIRNPVGAVTKWPPSSPLPLPHFVAVVWPKGTDPNKTGMYVDSWATDTKRGSIREYAYEYSMGAGTAVPEIKYSSKAQRVIKLSNGTTRVIEEDVENSIPVVEGNPWVFVK